MARLARSRRTSFDDSWFFRAGSMRAPLEIIAALDPHLSEARTKKLTDSLDGRTRNTTVVIEGMVDTGNIAAVMRTADSFGVQEIHVVDTATSYKHSRRTSQGAEKWLDRFRWHSVAECVEALRRVDRRIAAAHLDPAATAIDGYDFTRPTALVFGNELGGLTDEMLAAADDVVAIPTGGMTQSLNISVAAGICLYRAREQRIAALGYHGDLLPDDRLRLHAIWAMKSVANVDALLDRLFTDRDGAL